eukprot:17260-Eustigmatos_ZCMA.PRE.1
MSAGHQQNHDTTPLMLLLSDWEATRSIKAVHARIPRALPPLTFRCADACMILACNIFRHNALR